MATLLRKAGSKTVEKRMRAAACNVRPRPKRLPK